MTNGTIKAISDRGFAFITAEDGQDVFMHRSACESATMFDALSVGDIVEFEFVEPRPPKGARAKAVRYPEVKEVNMMGAQTTENDPKDGRPLDPPRPVEPHPASTRTETQSPRSVPGRTATGE